MKKILAFVVAAAMGLPLVALWILRYAAFAALMFLRPVFIFVFGCMAGMCLLGLVLGLIIARDQHDMLWLFFGVGVASSVLLFCYDALVLLLAPSRFPMLLAR